MLSKALYWSPVIYMFKHNGTLDFFILRRNKMYSHFLITDHNKNLFPIVFKVGLCLPLKNFQNDHCWKWCLVTVYCYEHVHFSNVYRQLHGWNGNWSLFRHRHAPTYCWYDNSVTCLVSDMSLWWHALFRYVVGPLTYNIESGTSHMLMVVSRLVFK